MTTQSLASTVPGMDHDDADFDIDSAMDDILGSSEILSQAGILPNSSNEDDDDNADTDEDLGDSDESSAEEDKADGEEDDEEADDEGDDSEEETTEDDESDDDDSEEIDWDYQVPVKIDGEETKVTLQELQKGYQTSQHLSKQGRELANERKEFEKAKKVELEEVVSAAKTLRAQSTIQEDSLAKEYADLQAKHKAAKKDGDKYEAEKISDKMEEVQSEYWRNRKTREKITESLTKHEEEQAAKDLEIGIAQFNEEIGDYIPDFNPEKAKAIREFAVSKGISEEVLASLVDAKIIGAINEFMELSQKVGKGQVKRKAKPVRKATPTKKAVPAKQKAAVKQKEVSNRLMKGELAEGDFDSVFEGIADKYF